VLPVTTSNTNGEHSCYSAAAHYLLFQPSLIPPVKGICAPTASAGKSPGLHTKVHDSPGLEPDPGATMRTAMIERRCNNFAWSP
jgi:hypothetical protein